MKLKTKTLQICAILLLFHLLANFYILQSSRLLRRYDEADRIFEGVMFYRALTTGDSFRDAVFYNLSTGQHPKLFSLIEGLTLVFLEKFGLKDISLAILLTNLFFLTVLLLSVFQIGSILKDKKTGILAAILLSFSPAIFSHSRIAMLDFPLAAMISLSFLFLLKTGNFRSLVYSILAGILLGLSQLTKEAALIFIIPILIYCLISLFYKRKTTKGELINFSIVVFIFLFVAGIVYLHPVNEGVLKIFSVKSLLIKTNDNIPFYYFTNFSLLYLGVLLSIVFLPLFLNYLINIKKRNIFLFIWFFMPFLIFSISPNKSCRFIIPALPPFYLLMASEIFDPFFLRVRNRYIAVLILASFFQYAVFNFFPKIALYPSVKQAELLYDKNFDLGILSVRKDKDFYLIENLIDFFEREKIDPRKDRRILFLFNLGFETSLKYEFAFRDMPVGITVPMATDATNTPFPGETDWNKYLMDFDYVIDKTGSLGMRGRLEDISGKLKKAMRKNKDSFGKVASFKRSNGDHVFIYRNLKKI